jgi:hypothetical protein
MVEKSGTPSFTSNGHTSFLKESGIPSLISSLRRTESIVDIPSIFI